MCASDVFRWRDFNRSMFWLAVIGGSLILLHALVLFVLRLRKDREKKWSYGALVFPRFEIFLTILAIPCICKASVNVVKGISNPYALCSFSIAMNALHQWFSHLKMIGYICND